MANQTDRAAFYLCLARAFLPPQDELAYDAINSEDLSLLMGTVLIATLFIVLANLAVDIIQAFIDPRVRLQ